MISIADKIISSGSAFRFLDGKRVSINVGESVTAIRLNTIITHADDLICAGYQTIGGTTYALILKINSAGDIIWQRQVNSSAGIFEKGSIICDASGNINAVWRSSGGTIYCTLCKFDASGTLVWQRKLSNAASISTDGVGIDDDNNVYVGAMFYSGSNKAHVIKYNDNGLLIWQRQVLASEASGYPLLVTPAGSVYSKGAAGVIFKRNTDGSVVWKKKYTETATAYAYELLDAAIDYDENIYFCAKIGSALALLKIDSTGDVISAIKTESVAAESAINIENELVLLTHLKTDEPGFVLLDTDLSIDSQYQVTRNDPAISTVQVHDGINIGMRHAISATDRTVSNSNDNTYIYFIPANGADFVGDYDMHTIAETSYIFSDVPTTVATATNTEQAGELTDAVGELTLADTTYTTSIAGMT